MASSDPAAWQLSQMANRRARCLRIRDNLTRLDNLDPFLMPARDVLRSFIDDLLRDMVEEAIDLKAENDFRESAMLLNRCLLVYVQHVYPLNLQTPEDEKRVVEIRIFKATMSVFSGMFSMAIGEAKKVLNMMTVSDEQTREMKLILKVAEAGMDLLKFRQNPLKKTELKKHRPILYPLKGSEEENMVNYMIKELDKELGSYVDAAEVENRETIDLAWVPDDIKKHQEKICANKEKKKEVPDFTFKRYSTITKGDCKLARPVCTVQCQDNSPSTQQVLTPLKSTNYGLDGFEGTERGAHTPQRSQLFSRQEAGASYNEATHTFPHVRPAHSSDQSERLLFESLSSTTQKWLQRYQFRLACTVCFVQDSCNHGIQAFQFIPEMPHVCKGDILICLLNSQGQDRRIWGRIRQRRDPNFQGPFSLCQTFLRGLPCQNPYNVCHFAHSQEELLIWQADKREQFNGKELVNFLRKHLQCKKSLFLASDQKAAEGMDQNQLHPSSSLEVEQRTLQQMASAQLTTPSPVLRESLPTTPTVATPVRDPHPEEAVGKNNHQKEIDEVSASEQATRGRKSVPEQTWNAKDGSFQTKSSGSTFETSKMVEELINNLQGYFAFCCKQCFHDNPPRIHFKHPKETSKCDSNRIRHDWNVNNRILVFFSYVKEFRKVRPRPPNRPARVSLCWNDKRHNDCSLGENCLFAHNDIEVELWEFEMKHSFISRDEIVETCNRIYGSPTDCKISAGIQSIQNMQADLDDIPPFKYDLRVLCGLCFPEKVSLPDDKDPTRCSLSLHNWAPVRAVYQLKTKSDEWVRVFPRHPQLNSIIHPSLCSQGPRCVHRGGHNVQCILCHYPEEIDLWVYQNQYSRPTIEDVIAVKNSTHSNSNKSTTNKYRPMRPPHMTPMSRKDAESQFPCTYCNKAFEEKWKLEQHLKSPDHLMKINTDKEKKWDHRDPPHAVTNGDYQICQYDQSGMCRYSRKSADENLCDYAHGEKELQEWKQRHKYRMMKMEKLKEQRLFSFLDNLLQEYNFTNQKETVITHQLPGVEVICEQDYDKSINVGDKTENESYETFWRFRVNCGSEKLNRIGLLYDEHRLNFYLSRPIHEKRPQICPGNQLVVTNESAMYFFEILFTSDVLGIFHQWLVLDFGKKPALYVSLKVRIGSEDFQPQIRSSPAVSFKEPWSSANSVIVEYPECNPTDEFYDHLQERYPLPPPCKIVLKKGQKMNHNNYKDHLHKMLFVEELACNERLKKYSGWTKLDLYSELTENGYHVAQGGELYARISLAESLLDDSEASQIVVSNVRSALIKFEESSDKVYQARILTEKHLDLRKSDSVFVSLSSQCVQDQNLKPNKTLSNVLVQFQLDRIAYCEMHCGVDNITEMRLIFPPDNMNARFPDVRKDECEGTNPRQAAALKYIVGAGKSLPFLHGPTLIIGPFGTGKTQTIAFTIMKLLDQSADNKILVCTHSNSAADLLITSHLHPFLVRKNCHGCNTNLLRVYATVRNPATVPEDIRSNYAIFEEGVQPTQFRKPTYQDVKGCNIVIATLATSIHLVAMGDKNLKGYFGYIIIDEAGQALETEVVIPMGLATENTVVVLAGDHIQMRPKVYSEVARSHNFHISMLERLFYWDKRWRCNNVCFLTDNYRMISEILNFIGRYHYHTELVAISEHYRHKHYHPMSFLTVKGNDQLIGTSYINMAEVNAIVEQVEKLARNWPHQWRDVDIAVLTPYRPQVNQIRNELRKRGFGYVNVETVKNVQGKQFRAVFISTVRTRNTLNKAQITAITSSSVQNEQYYYGFLSDEGELVTAFTRCQSLLFVVGDPIALCSVGNCHGVWEKYIKECEDNYSLYPYGTTLETIKQEVQAAKQQLNPYASIFQPSPRTEELKSTGGIHKNTSPYPKPPPVPSAWMKGPPTFASTNTSLHREETSASKNMSSQAWLFSGNNYPPSYELDEEVIEDEFGDFDEDLDIDDEILKELRRQVQKDEMTLRQSNTNISNESEESSTESNDDENSPIVDPSGSQGFPTTKDAKHDDVGSYAVGETLVDQLASEEKTLPNRTAVLQSVVPNFHMVEKDGGIYLVRGNISRSNLRSARDVEIYDSDEDGEVSETELNPNDTDYWLQRTVEHPDEYKICSMRFEPSGRVYAIARDGIACEEIIISSKRRRDRALDGDKVVIHILSETEGDYETLPQASTEATNRPLKLYGEVKHILERSINPKFKKIVCTIDPINNDLMCPIDRSFPRMFPMGRKKRQLRGNDGDQSNQVGTVTSLQLYNIKNQGKGVLEKSRVINVKYSEMCNRLFVVQYFEWFPETPYPMGIVTEELPLCNSPRNGMRILKLMHGVKDNWPRSSSQELEEFSDDWEIPKSEIIARELGDFRSKHAFTIDPTGSLDLDDALHLERLDDGGLRVGVHISDVSFFIKKDSNLDQEARKRAVTFYPTFHARPSHMLPTKFSTILCSLLPGKEKLTLSVLFIFDKSGEISGEPEILKSIICSAQRLTYQQVELVLTDGGDHGVLPVIQGQLRDLHNLTSFVRQNRLGDGRFFHKTDEGDENTAYPTAHTLVEEMMILTNEAIAKFLISKLGKNIPVRCQPPPDAVRAQDWLSQFRNDGETGLKLSSMVELIKSVAEEDAYVERRFHHDEDDSCSSPESDISDFSVYDDTEEAIGVPLTKDTWENIKRTLDNPNHSHLDVEHIIGDEGGHPMQAVALSQLQRILPRTIYANANDPLNGCRHFSLQKEFYTHFTSPIRRFIDLVVHRMVVASLHGENAPYNAMEVAEICHHCTNQTFKANKFKQMTLCLLSALKLQIAAEPKLVFIESTSDYGFQMLYPHERYLAATRSSTDVALKHMKPSRKPEDGDKNSSVVLHFKNSIYDLKADVPEIRRENALLRTDRFIKEIPKSSWKRVLTSLKLGDNNRVEDLLGGIIATSEVVSIDFRECSRISEITSEIDSRYSTDDEVTPKKYVDFECDYCPGQVIQVQLSAGLERGLLVPKVQLLNMTPKFNFCIEHRENPVTCFAKIAERPPGKCKNITQYVNSWLPVVEMISVHSAVSGDETIYVRDVQIQWFKKQLKDKTVIKCGCFSLRSDWCKDRNIPFYIPKKPKSVQPLQSKNPKGGENNPTRDTVAAHYLCIRIDGHRIRPSVQMELKKLEHKPGDSFDTKNPHRGEMSVVVHGVITSVSEDTRTKQMNIQFKEHYSSCQIPEELFYQDNSPLTCCTVEIIPKSLPDRRAENAVVNVADQAACRNLTRRICLQRPLKDMNNIEDSDNVSKHLLKEGNKFDTAQKLEKLHYNPPNESQRQALHMAMSNTFTVIQGPPGTGKTRTGAYLAYFFHLLNQTLPCNPRTGITPQILYCGPSNKSVDVIAGYLKEFMNAGDDFSIIRVYSESIEQQDFPMPGMSSVERKFGSNEDAKMDPEHRNISLHYRIRAHGAPHAHDINNIEKELKRTSRRITKTVKEKIAALKKLILTAMTEELKKHKIILCTCNASGRHILSKKGALNVIQVIIDEAGMCSEPDTLIPLVDHNPSQVVLIGDHMQLRPIIQEPHARELGAEKSLMEKYKDRAYTLTIQYRMHEEICRFPSIAFYQGELRTAQSVKDRGPDRETEHIWPNNYPRVFCHVVGEEEVLSVRSIEGNEMSRSNPQEVYHVIRIAKYLVQHLGVRPTQVAVLSQYRLQCSRIAEELNSAGLSNIHVSTVIKSQGSEWDYVIFSTVRSMRKIEIEEKPGKGWKIRHLGFTMDENQMNVAMTRAKRGHIVVGNRYLLRTVDKWKALIETYEGTGSVLPANDFLRYPNRS